MAVTIWFLGEAIGCQIPWRGPSVRLHPQAPSSPSEGASLQPPASPIQHTPNPMVWLMLAVPLNGDVRGERDLSFCTNANQMLKKRQLT